MDSSTQQEHLLYGQAIIPAWSQAYGLGLKATSPSPPKEPDSDVKWIANTDTPTKNPPISPPDLPSYSPNSLAGFSTSSTSTSNLPSDISKEGRAPATTNL
eukprot:9190330-Ditylum_brightwellii.AAC.1